MAVATCVNHTPWAATVAFAYDGELNLYFISSATARHIQMIAQNPKVAVAMHEHQSPRYDMTKVKGLQLEGTAEILAGRKAIRGLEVFVRRFPKAQVLSIEKLFAIYNARIIRIRPERIFFLDKERFPERVEYPL